MYRTGLGNFSLVNALYKINLLSLKPVIQQKDNKLAIQQFELARQTTCLASPSTKPSPDSAPAWLASVFPSSVQLP